MQMSFFISRLNVQYSLLNFVDDTREKVEDSDLVDFVSTANHLFASDFGVIFVCIIFISTRISFFTNFNCFQFKNGDFLLLEQSVEYCQRSIYIFHIQFDHFEIIKIWYFSCVAPMSITSSEFEKCEHWNFNEKYDDFFRTYLYT